jgi:hypothetical protein
MADLSFRPDPEPQPEAKPRTEKTPHPPWVAGCKSGLMTVLTFFFLLFMVFVMCAGFLVTNHHLEVVDKKLDDLQKNVNDLRSQKPDDKKVMPPAGN